MWDWKAKAKKKNFLQTKHEVNCWLFWNLFFKYNDKNCQCLVTKKQGKCNVIQFCQDAWAPKSNGFCIVGSIQKVFFEKFVWSSCLYWIISLFSDAFLFNLISIQSLYPFVGPMKTAILFEVQQPNLSFWMLLDFTG
jgi:hypothetical protein